MGGAHVKCVGGLVIQKCTKLITWISNEIKWMWMSSIQAYKAHKQEGAAKNTVLLAMKNRLILEFSQNFKTLVQELVLLDKLTHSQTLIRVISLFLTSLNAILMEVCAQPTYSSSNKPTSRCLIAGSLQ